jgi:hypothetical protein
MHDTATIPNLEAALELYLEQEHNYELWLVAEEMADALDRIYDTARAWPGMGVVIGDCPRCHSTLTLTLHASEHV